MAIEESPIYEALVREIGTPIQVPAMDCTYASVIELAGYKFDRSAAPAAPVEPAAPAAEAAIPAPAKLTPRAAQKPMASVARKNAS
jgi:hypothetical protein